MYQREATDGAALNVQDVLGYINASETNSTRSRKWLRKQSARTTLTCDQVSRLCDHFCIVAENKEASHCVRAHSQLWEKGATQVLSDLPLVFALEKK